MSVKFQLPTQKGTELFGVVTRQPTIMKVVGSGPDVQRVLQRYSGLIAQFQLTQAQNYSLSTTPHVQKRHVVSEELTLIYSNQGGMESITALVTPISSESRIEVEVLPVIQPDPARGGRTDIVCVTVIDENQISQEDFNTEDEEFHTFTQLYPRRYLVVLRPSPQRFGELVLPGAFYSYPRAFGPISVTRDGEGAAVTDWYAILVANVPFFSEKRLPVSLVVDSSGSMTTDTVVGSSNLFFTRLEQAKHQYVFTIMLGERPVSDHLRRFPEFTNVRPGN